VKLTESERVDVIRRNTDYSTMSISWERKYFVDNFSDEILDRFMETEEELNCLNSQRAELLILFS
jgi:hypothetical protein